MPKVIKIHLINNTLSEWVLHRVNYDGKSDLDYIIELSRDFTVLGLLYELKIMGDNAWQSK